MVNANSSAGRPSVKVTYLERQKRTKRQHEDDRDQDSASDSPSESYTGKITVNSSKLPQGPESRAPKKVDVCLPGPEPSNSPNASMAKPPPSAIPPSKVGHKRSSSSMSSIARLSQKTNVPSPASAPKPPSTKPASKRGASPDTEFDDTESIAESTASGSFGRIRRNEGERIAYFRNQPDCGILEPFKAECTRCKKFVSLGRKQTYTVRPWELHRSRCDQNAPANDDDEKQPDPKEEKLRNDLASEVASLMEDSGGRKTEDERKAILENDARAECVKPDEVQCRKCQKWIRLSNKRNYVLSNWNAHQAACSDAKPSSRVATAERKLRIVNDSRAKSFGTGYVVCASCSLKVELEGEGDYNLAKWEEHKESCVPATKEKQDAKSSVIEDFTTATNSVPFPSQPAPPLSASAEGTLVEPSASPSTSQKKGMKRSREDSEDRSCEEEERPSNRPRSETYEAPSKDAPSPLGWFLLPFKAFVRGFKESLKSS